MPAIPIRVVRQALLLVAAGLAILPLPVLGADSLDPGTTTVSGTLDVYQEDDFARGLTRRSHFLTDPISGKTYRLEFALAPDQHLISGSTVVVRGRIQDKSIIVEESIEVVERAMATEADSRRALVLIVDFQNAAVTCSDALVQDKMFTGTQSVDGLYQETSFGLVSFPGDTDGDGQPDVFRVSIGAQTTDACDPSGWANEADQAATNAGVNLSLYQHKVYVLPTNSCGWAGRGSIGCAVTCRVWNQNCTMQDVYAHELGHNLGMYHASTDLNNDGTIDSTYGDWSDFMGIGGVGWRQVNGPHKEQMSWIPPTQVLEVTVTGTHDYTISPLESDPASAAHPQLLKIFRPDRGDYYYISYRRQIGYDATLRTEYAEQTNVHRYSGSGNTRFIVALDDGQEYIDPDDGLTFTQLAHDDLAATVRLSNSCGAGSPDADGDGTPDCSDGCPTDPAKTTPGECGCGSPDTDSDGDGTADCNDGCPSDPNKVAAGVCGCGTPDVDSDGDGTPDCPISLPAVQNLRRIDTQP